MGARMTWRESLYDVVKYVAGIIAATAIAIGVVLAVDAVVLLLINQWKVDKWLLLLSYEGLAMAVVGSAGWWRVGGQRPEFWSIPSGKRLYRIRVSFKQPWFWVSLGMAGFMLFILSAYLYLQLY